MSRPIVLADTGAVYALVDRDDAWHARVRQWWLAATTESRLPELTLPEVAYLLGQRIGPAAERGLVEALASGDLVIEPTESSDYSRAADIMQVYSDLPLGLVDAVVCATAERLEVSTILTTDRRHFGALRPAHRASFLLAP